MSGGPSFFSLLREETFMLRRGFTLIEMLIVLAIACILITICVSKSDAQEVQPAQVGTITSAPGLVVLPNSGLNVFRPNTVVGPVVTFPRVAGSNVDWAAIRAGRLASIALEAADNVNFEFDSANLTEGSEEALVDFAALLIANPDINVAVEGHTDSVGEPTYNMALSLRRAETVRRALQAVGLSSDRVEVFAHGAGALLIKRALPDERRKNRRVEFHLIDGFTGERFN
jgi:prepilin-type N-terminal cleavage/methylation domain-containing protein